MSKEALLIFLLGIGLGSIIAFGAWRANSALNNKAYSVEVKNESSSTPTVTETKTEANKLTVAKPNDLDVSLEDDIAVSGITRKGAKIVISGESKDYILDANAEGVFEQNINLNGGLNQVLIASFANGSRDDERLRLFYSGELKSMLPADSSVKVSSEEAVKNTAKNKLDLVKKDLKGIMGTITDKTNNALQVKDPQGIIQQISVDESLTTFAKIGKTTASAKYSDVAIGDYVIALGYKETTGVLKVLRILITSQTEETDRKIYSGAVGKIDKKNMTIKLPDGKEEVVAFPSRWTGPEIKELKDNYKIIVVSYLKDGKRTVRTIEIIK